MQATKRQDHFLSPLSSHKSAECQKPVGKDKHSVGINNLGTVIVTFGPAGSTYLQLWRRADGEAFTQVAPVVGISASINDLGETAYVTFDPKAPIREFLVRNSNGTITTLARSDLSPFLSSGTTYLPSLNNSGNAVFQGGTGGDSIFIDPAGTTVFDHSTDPLLFATTASMNDSGTVAFVAIRPDSSVPSGSRVGIYRGSLTPLVEDGGLIIEAVGLNRPAINNSGTVAFIGRISGTGTASILTTDDDVNFTTVGTLLESTGRISINNHGTVAYRGPGEAVYAGSNRVIGAGDLLDGSTVQFALVWEESINDGGQVAFWASLADGRAGVYRADPVTTNSPPVLAAIGNKVVNEGAMLVFTATATDSDVPANNLTFSLDSEAPSGAAITSAGSFSWIPTEAQGPGSYPVTIRVTDNGNPSQSDSETITIQVNEVNSPPVIAPIGNKTVKKDDPLTFTANATDPDVALNTLTFSLGAGAPTGASIDPTTGRFTWTPSKNQMPGNYSVTIRVTDNGSPALTDPETITITVLKKGGKP